MDQLGPCWTDEDAPQCLRMCRLIQSSLKHTPGAALWTHFPARLSLAAVAKCRTRTVFSAVAQRCDQFAFSCSSRLGCGCSTGSLLKAAPEALFKPVAIICWNPRASLSQTQLCQTLLVAFCSARGQMDPEEMSLLPGGAWVELWWPCC